MVHGRLALAIDTSNLFLQFEAHLCGSKIVETRWSLPITTPSLAPRASPLAADCPAHTRTNTPILSGLTHDSAYAASLHIIVSKPVWNVSVCTHATLRTAQWRSEYPSFRCRKIQTPRADSATAEAECRDHEVEVGGCDREESRK